MSEAVPQSIVVPHEHVAVSMAHGHFFATGEPAAVILHTNVGLANGAIGAINAATDHVPMILMSGRTPATEAGRFGSRTVPIGWGQEMRDQAALVREACKWDYEVRFPEQVPELLDRALRDRHQHPEGSGLPEPAPRGAVRTVPGRGAGHPAGDGGGDARPESRGSAARGVAAGPRRTAADHRPTRRRVAGRVRRPGRDRRHVDDPGLPVVGGRHGDLVGAPDERRAATRVDGWPRPTSCW